MAGQKTISSTYHEPLPPPPPHPPDMLVTGDGGPVSPNGNYYKDGIYAGKMSYRRLDGAFFLYWFSISNRYYLSTTKGNIISRYWAIPVQGPVGTYLIHNVYTGTPEVS